WLLIVVLPATTPLAPVTMWPLMCPVLLIVTWLPPLTPIPFVEELMTAGPMTPELLMVTVPVAFSLTLIPVLVLAPVTVPVLVMVVEPVALDAFCMTLMPENCVPVAVPSFSMVMLPLPTAWAVKPVLPVALPPLVRETLPPSKAAVPPAR